MLSNKLTKIPATYHTKTPTIRRRGKFYSYTRVKRRWLIRKPLFSSSEVRKFYSQNANLKSLYFARIESLKSLYFEARKSEILIFNACVSVGKRPHPYKQSKKWKTKSTYYRPLPSLSDSDYSDIPVSTPLREIFSEYGGGDALEPLPQSNLSKLNLLSESYSRFTFIDKVIKSTGANIKPLYTNKLKVRISVLNSSVSAPYNHLNPLSKLQDLVSNKVSMSTRSMSILGNKPLLHQGNVDYLCRRSKFSKSRLVKKRLGGLIRWIVPLNVFMCGIWKFARDKSRRNKSSYGKSKRNRYHHKFDLVRSPVYKYLPYKHVKLLNISSSKISRKVKIGLSSKFKTNFRRFRCNTLKYQHPTFLRSCDTNSGIKRPLIDLWSRNYPRKMRRAPIRHSKSLPTKLPKYKILFNRANYLLSNLNSYLYTSKCLRLRSLLLPELLVQTRKRKSAWSTRLLKYYLNKHYFTPPVTNLKPRYATLLRSLYKPTRTTFSGFNQTSTGRGNNTPRTNIYNSFYRRNYLMDQPQSGCAFLRVVPGLKGSISPKLNWIQTHNYLLGSVALKYINLSSLCYSYATISPYYTTTHLHNRLLTQAGSKVSLVHPTNYPTLRWYQCKSTKAAGTNFKLEVGSLLSEKPTAGEFRGDTNLESLRRKFFFSKVGYFRTAHFNLYLKYYKPLVINFYNNKLNELDYFHFLNLDTFQVSNYSLNNANHMTKVPGLLNFDNDILLLYCFVYEPYAIFASKLSCSIVQLTQYPESQKPVMFLKYVKAQHMYSAKFSNLCFTDCKRIFTEESRRCYGGNRYRILTKPLLLKPLRYDSSLPFFLKLFKKYSRDTLKQHTRVLYNRLHILRNQLKVVQFRSKFFCIKRYIKFILVHTKSVKLSKSGYIFRENFFKRKRLVRKRKTFKFLKFLNSPKFRFYKTELSQRLGNSHFKKVYHKTRLLPLSHVVDKRNLSLDIYSRGSMFSVLGKTIFDSSKRFKGGYITNPHLLLLFASNPIIYKLVLLEKLNTHQIKNSSLAFYYGLYERLYQGGLGGPNVVAMHSNILPHNSFKWLVSKRIVDNSVSERFKPMATQWYYFTVIRFIEFLSGRKVLFQFYPALASEVPDRFLARYLLWIPRMTYYERKLGHRFFLEESVHIIHLSLELKDVHMFTTWLNSLIRRISFWRTRLIFRFLKYLFHHYFRHIFEHLDIKGLKIKLKGKISAAGNSRKRTILYRTGLTSHSSINLKVLYDFQLINTFTGVQGLQVWLFY